jgi:hypothetical protein
MAKGKTKTKAAKKVAKKAKTEGSPLSKAAAKKALAREGAHIAALGKNVAANAWQIGRRLLQIAELGLAEPAGYASPQDYAEQVHGIARSTAFRYMRVAAAFPEVLVRASGVDKLDRALAYIAATPEDETAKDVPSLKVRVLGEDGEVVVRPFADVSVKDLARAAAHEAEVHAAPKRVDPDVTKHAAALARANRALDRVVGKSNAARAEVSLRAVDGVVLLELRGLPLSDARSALAAIRKALG